MNKKLVEKIGWVASVMAILMYFSFIDQIRLNLAGQKGSLLIPVLVTVNSVLWTLFGLGKKNRQIFVCNIPGIFIGIISFFTAL